MRRLAQFVRLLASRVSRLSASRVSRLASVCLASRVCLHLSASASRVSRLSASVSRLRLSRVCVCLASVSRLRLRLSRVCVCLASACICLACVSRLSRVCLASCASVSRASRVCVHLSRVKGSECVRLRASVSRQGFRMLASVCVGRLVSRLSVCPCECLRELAHFMRRSSFKEFKRFLLSSYYRCTYRLCRLYEQTFNILI